MWQAVNRLLSEHLGSAEIRERVELPGVKSTQRGDSVMETGISS